MQKYAIYTTETGEITGTCFCDNPQDQCRAGQSFIAVDAPVSGQTHRVESGAVVARQDAVLPPPPG